jgi:broad specificity phosphatase PhoE
MDDEMTRILFIRHGETEHNLSRRISTLAPGGPLNKRGCAQAERLAGRLRNLPVSRVYSSPLVRATQTAEILAAPHGMAVIMHNDLREISAGELDGRGDDASFDLLNAALDAWCLGDCTIRIGETGELGEAAIMRLRSLVDDLALRHPGETVLAVSHGGLLQTCLPWVCDNLTPQYGYQKLLANTAVIEIDADDDAVRCLFWDGAPVPAPANTSIRGGNK